MATRQEIEARIRALALELASELDEVSWEGEFGSPFEAIEVKAAEFGDRLTREIATEQCRRANDEPPPTGHTACPHCEQPGELRKLRKRQLQTIRGEIEIEEPEYYCRKCRRSFFPDSSMDRG